MASPLTQEDLDRLNPSHPIHWMHNKDGPMTMKEDNLPPHVALLDPFENKCNYPKTQSMSPRTGRRIRDIWFLPPTISKTSTLPAYEITALLGWGVEMQDLVDRVELDEKDTPDAIKTQTKNIRTRLCGQHLRWRKKAGGLGVFKSWRQGEIPQVEKAIVSRVLASDSNSWINLLFNVVDWHIDLQTWKMSQRIGTQQFDLPTPQEVTLRVQMILDSMNMYVPTLGDLNKYLLENNLPLGPPGSQ